MKEKIFVLIVTLLMCLTSIVIIHSDLEVKADYGDVGSEGENSFELDYEYIWNRTWDFCNVTYLAYDVDAGDIPRGRSFGSKGGEYTVENILKYQMNNTIGLEDVHTEQIKHINGTNKNYTSIINMTDFYLKINASAYLYPYENPIPKKEMFVIPVGLPVRKPNLLTQIFSFNNTKIYHNNMTDLWPFAGTFNNYTFAITNYNTLNYRTPVIVGNVTYINASGTIPGYQEQYGRVYLLDNTTGVQEKLDNITTAEGCIIIESGMKGNTTVNASKALISVCSVNSTDGTTLKGILENYTTVLVDNVTGNLTFTYNLNQGWWPSENHVFMDRIPNHYELWNATWLNDPLLKSIMLVAGGNANVNTYLLCMKLKTLYWSLISEFKENIGLPRCEGIILYDTYDYHYMVQIGNFWDTDPPYWNRSEFREHPLGYFLNFLLSY